ncbi:uncharacterized protein [Diadema antillarum]|uniref:uncharacterized protein n=1 Tax=Diadema antillarum TaxID=105358 RepID=UPI003A888537
MRSKESTIHLFPNKEEEEKEMQEPAVFKHMLDDDDRLKKDIEEREKKTVAKISKMKTKI